MDKWNKQLRYALNILKSFLYDLRIAVTDNLKLRAQANTFSAYAANRLYPGYLKRGAAMEGVRYLAKKYCHGKGIDVGSSVWPLEDARPIENHKHENAYLLTDKDASLDFVFSSHLLEHLERPEVAIAEWVRVLKREGVLLLYLPHPACSMWAPKNLSEHVWMPDPLTVKNMLQESGDFEVMEISYVPDGMMSYHIIAKRK